MSLPILCYHKVGPGAEEGRRLNIEPERLRSHVRFFQRRRHRLVAARDLAGSWPSRAVCMTFDDAYVSTLTYGVEVLRSEGVTASIYAVTDRVGEKSYWDTGNERPLADWPLLLAAQEAGIEIGNHSAEHPYLGKLSFEGQVAQVKRAHESLTSHGIQPGSFCLPYGHFGPDTRAAVEASGYSVSLSLIKRIAKEEDDRLMLPRVVVAYSDGLPMLIYRVYVRPRMRRPGPSS